MFKKIPDALSSNPRITFIVWVIQAVGVKPMSTFYHVGAYSLTWRAKAKPKYIIVVTTAAVRASSKKDYISMIKPKIACPYNHITSQRTMPEVYLKTP